MLPKHLEVYVYHQSHERPRDHLRVRVNGCEADDELLELGNVGYARNSVAKPLDVRQRLFQLVNCLKIILGFSKLSVGRNVGMFGWRSHHTFNRVTSSPPRDLRQATAHDSETMDYLCNSEHVDGPRR